MLVSTVCCTPHRWRYGFAHSWAVPLVTLSATPPTAASKDAEKAAAEKAFAGPPGNPAGEALDFPATAPAANPVFYRTYSRKTATGRESWYEVA